MKKIIFGIAHMAHLNFFKNAVYILKKEGFDVKICYLNRGNIRKVLKKEYPFFSITQIGDYSKSNFGKLKMSIEKLLLFLKYFNNEKPDFVTAVGDFILALAAKKLGISNVIFYDDFEFKLNYQISRLIGDNLVVPYPLPQQRKVLKYHSFKELAYIHPKYYTPDINIIKKMGLIRDDYIFVREVAGISLNYANLLENNLLNPIKYIYKKGLKIILSLEDKRKKEIYKPYCKILEEPVEDIYSLIKYARFCISSGDSMARESALLGVPAIYLGGRDMKINKPLINWGGIYKSNNSNEIKIIIDLLLNKDSKKKWNSIIKNKIDYNLNDTTKVIINSIKRGLKKRK